MRMHLLSMLRYIPFLSIIMVSVVSCTERIDLQTNKNIPKLAITGIITTEQRKHKIQVSRSVQYLGNEPTKYYLGGKVTLNGMYLEVDSFQNAYVTPKSFQALPGKTYDLNVWVDFDEDGVDELYTSTTTVPDFVPLDSIYLGSMSVTNPLGPPWMLFVAFQDPHGINYYGAGLSINNVNYSASLTSYSLNDFSAVEDGKHITFPVFYIDEEITYNYDEKLQLKPGDMLTLELNSLSPEYYEFIKAAQQEIDGGGNPLFAGPPANVPSNISNGALGIFGSCTVSRKKIILPETPTFPKQ